METSVMTRKGQVTIPAEIRRELRLREGDRVRFVREGANVRIEPVGDVVARTAGSLRAYAKTPSPTDAELRAAAEQAIADDVIERMNR